MAVAWLLRSGRVSSVREGLDWLARLRPQSQPNAGFIRQLELYHRMNCSVTTDSPLSPLYLNFALQHCKLQHVARLAATTAPPVPSRRIRCGKCRKILTCRHLVIPHAPGLFPHWSQDTVLSSECRVGVFVVDISLLPGQVTLQCWSSGNRLQCRHCSSNIGNWGLASCGCGARGARGIWLNSRKVDL